MAVSLVSLLWEDILFKHILSTLSIKDLFNLRGLSRDCKRLVDAYFEHLPELNLSIYHREISADAFMVLANRCKKLRRIIFSFCDWLTDDMVTPLFSNNPNLSYLVLNNCQGLSSACLQQVILVCKNLKCLKLENCFWLSVGCLEAITLHQDSLEEVDLTSCTGIFSTHAMNCFIKKFRNLRKVCLANNSCVTNSTLFAIARSCKNLEHINLRNCCLITDDGLRALIDGCSGLRSLLIMGCPRVSQRYLDSLRSHMYVDKKPVNNVSVSLMPCVARSPALYLQV